VILVMLLLVRRILLSEVDMAPVIASFLILILAMAFLWLDGKYLTQLQDAVWREKELRDTISEIIGELYGQGFEVSGWHENGDLEPLDTWFDDNGWCDVVKDDE